MPLPPLTSSRLRRAAQPAVAAAVVALCVTHASSAQAASVVATTGAIVTHTLPSGAGFTRDPTLNPSGINYEDCIEDVSFTFPITVSGATPGTDHFYVYAGTNCGDPAQRTGAAGTSCWQVVNGEMDYAVDTNMPISLKVRQILSQQYSGVSQPFVPTTSDAICHAQAVSAAQNLSVYFLIADGDGLTEAVAAANINADLSAAREPGNFVLDIGDTKLIPRWTAISDPDITGFNVYYMAQSASVSATLVTTCSDGGVTTTTGTSGDDGGTTAAMRRPRRGLPRTAETWAPTPPTPRTLPTRATWTATAGARRTPVTAAPTPRAAAPAPAAETAPTGTAARRRAA